MVLDSKKIILRKKRKSGIFYLLYDGNKNYKIGVTSNSVHERLLHAKRLKKINYELVYVRHVKDIFYFEKIYKWRLWQFKLPPIEFFSAPSNTSLQDFIYLADNLTNIKGIKL